VAAHYRPHSLLTTPLTSGADVSMPAFEPQEDVVIIYCDNISQNVTLSVFR